MQFPYFVICAVIGLLLGLIIIPYIIVALYSLSVLAGLI